MDKADIIRRLHEMVDQLEAVPDHWFEDCYPMHHATFVAKDGSERITLVVGVTDQDAADG